MPTHFFTGLQVYELLVCNNIVVPSALLYRETGYLGSGQFGTVSKGVWSHPKGTKEVALKTLNEDATPTDKIKFLQEAAIMCQFRHPGVIQLYGVVGRGKPVSRSNLLQIV